jgi:acetyl esterase/lipase
MALAVATMPVACMAGSAMGTTPKAAPRAVPALMAHVPPPPATRIEREVAYGSDPAQKLDLYRPAKAVGAPMLMMVHGGGWWRGDKANTVVVDNKVGHWIPKGYILASVNYRTVPQADPVAQAGDVAEAVAFVQAHAKEWGGDPARVVLMGHSAGAHLAVLLAAAPPMAARAGVKPWLGTVALDSAAYDVVQVMRSQHLDLFDRAFGTDEQLWRAASPTLRLEAAPAPVLLACSTRRVDACPQAEAFADKVRSLHGRAVVIPLDMTHGEINGLLGTEVELTGQVDAFLGSLGLP